MKSVVFVRHAKSSWESPGMKDFDRPLNDRGHRDAPMMAKRLLDKDVKIDLFLSSSALRALTTAKYFHETFKASKSHLVEEPALYHASVETFYKEIAKLDDKVKTVAIFSHNPGITHVVNSMAVAKVDDMPTCGVFAVHADIDNWQEFEKAPKQFWFFDYPKL